MPTGTSKHSFGPSTDRDEGLILSHERIARARVAYEDAGFDGVIVASPGAVAFLSGHVVPPHLAFPSRDNRLELPTLTLSVGDDTTTFGMQPMPVTGQSVVFERDELDATPGSMASQPIYTAIIRAARELGFRGGRIGVEVSHVPVAVTLALQDAWPSVEIVPLGRTLWRARAEKDPEELAYVTNACALADGGQAAARSVVKEGSTIGDVVAGVQHAITRSSGGSALVGCETDIAGVTFSAPERWKARPLRPGDLVICDIFPRHESGMWGDTCSTIPCGGLARAQRDVWGKVVRALEVGQGMLRPGIRCSDLYAAMASVIDDRGPYLGHGIGWDHFEEPIISARSIDELPPNATIVLEPGVFSETWGVRLEWAFRVTPSGGEALSTFSLGWEA